MYKKPYKIKRKKNILKNRFFLSGILGFFVCLGVFYLICFAPFFQIKTINISGCQKVQPKELENVIRGQAEEKVVFLKTRSIFLADSKKITEEVLKYFPQLEKITFKKDLPNKLVILVEERKPSLVLCQGEKYFLVDKNGIAYEEASEADENSLKLKNQTLVSAIKLGEMAVSPDLLSQMIKIRQIFNNLEINLVEMEIVSEQRLNVKTAVGFEVYFNLKGDISWQIVELKTILENKILPKSWKNLKYIDLRFDRVFVSPEGLLED
jgi:cell division septal protein FtsQ